MAGAGPIGGGGGPYDEACALALKAAGAEGVVLLVFNGKHGQGFEVQGPPRMLAALPEVLRGIADSLEEGRNLSLINVGVPDAVKGGN